MQKTNFKYEILIHDDASTDNTQAIIKKYAENNKELFITVLQRENQLSKGVRIIREFLYPIAKGKYIANCEGDDYWTDPLKLQKQVDFLEENKSYGLIRTDYSRLIDRTGELIKSHNKNIERKVPEGNIYNNLLLENSIGTQTVLYRKELILQNWNSPFLSGLMKYKMGDYPNWLIISLYSKIGYIDNVTATYRVLESSASHFKEEKAKWEFLFSEFQVKFDFIEEFGCEKKVKEIIQKKYFEKKIEYGFYIKDNKMVRDNYIDLEKISKPRLKERMMFLSSKFKYSRSIINFLIKFKNRL